MTTAPGERLIGGRGDLVERVRSRLISAGLDPAPAHVAAALRDEGLVLGDAAMLSVVDTLASELRGAGPLQELLELPGVTDVLVNSPTDVFFDRGSGLERARVSFRDDRAVRVLAQRLAAAAGRRLDDSSPHVDARLHDGVRFHAVLAPIAVSGTCLSLRVPRSSGYTIDELQQLGTFDAAGARWLRALVDSRASFVVSGGTGCGKTTLLNTLLSTIDPAHRVVVVEDSAELRPQHPHVVRLEARPANVEGSGSVTMRDLVRQALRMRPDRLVVGEVRGAEVVELLAALNTGHEGGCGTVHANSATDVPARLEALALAAGLGREALHAQVSAGLDAVVHIHRDHGGVRRLDCIAAFERSHSGEVRCSPAISWVDGAAVRGAAFDRLAKRLGVAGDLA
jgi:pilus assembly protein CpaF